MKEEYAQLLEEASKSKKRIKQSIKKLRKLKKGVVDAMIHDLHDEAFEQIDCLECANCCKGTGPLLKNRDIERISRSLSMKAGDFVADYLRIDEDNDYVFQSLPCPFLAEDHYCNIYDDRPKACSEFPHTDRVNQLGILSLTEKNAQICPAVAYIFMNLEV